MRRTLNDRIIPANRPNVSYCFTCHLLGILSSEWSYQACECINLLNLTQSSNFRCPGHMSERPSDELTVSRRVRPGYLALTRPGSPSTDLYKSQPFTQKYTTLQSARQRVWLVAAGVCPPSAGAEPSRRRAVGLEDGSYLPLQHHWLAAW